ncbi:uncharacterized protein LOC123667588 [Melitaea cinxia]|uniref:uncharacterized protein LOC123667588 n=1 Tax=Melitaea cinxia TaxID=113334 RepID=UPI001E2735E0|nr:uncharacterized protein LOC123667588 [Melitaea cinxia]
MISLIRERSCLWDKTDAGYRDKLRREDAWSEVYRELYPTYDNLKEMQKSRIGQQISKKWFNIRDAYVKSIKGPKKRPYIYSKAMSFLDKVILGDRYNSSDYLEEQSLEGEPEVWLNETFIDVDVPAQEPPTKKHKPDYSCFLESQNDTVASILSKMINREEDEDRAFFTSIMPTVKALPDNAKLEFRIEVMQVLKKFKNDTNKGIVVKTRDSDSE